MGSAGGSGYSDSSEIRPGGNGGGIIKITTSGLMTINGTISSNGIDGTVDAAAPYRFER